VKARPSVEEPAQMILVSAACGLTRQFGHLEIVALEVRHPRVEQVAQNLGDHRLPIERLRLPRHTGG